MSKALELAKFGRESAPTGLVVGDTDAQTLSAKTFSDGPVFSGLNANGVPFLNASKVLSSSSTFVFDGTNIGLGIASPAATLHVNASGGGTIRASRSSVGGEYIQLDHDGTDGTVRVSGNNRLNLLTNGLPRIIVTGGGSVGIGGALPNEILTVSNSNYEALGLYRNLDYNSVGAMGTRMYFGGYVGSTPTRSAALDGTLMTATTGRLSLSVLIGGTMTESLRVETNGSVRIGGTFAALVSNAEKLTVAGGTAQAATLSNTSDTNATVYFRNTSTTADTIQPYVYFTDGSGNRAGFGIKVTDASAHHYAQGGFNWYTGSAGFSGLRATLNSNGLGIGTNDPQSLLTLNSGGTDSLAAATITQSTDFAITSRAGFSGLTNNNGGFYFGMGANGTGIPAGFGFFREASGWDTAIAFYTNNVTSGPNSTRAMQEKMRLTSAGRLGIGTNSPAGGLHVGVGGSVLSGANPAIGVSSPSFAGLVIGFDGSPNLAQIVATNPSDAQMAFYTKPSGSAPVERMRILASGDVAIGDSTASGYKLKVAGTFNVTGAAVIGSYVSAGSIVANDPGAGYYSYNNRIGGSLAVVGTLYNAGNTYSNKFILNQGSAGVTRTSGSVSAGWYRFARSDFATGGYGARGGCTFYMYTTGGWSGPGQTKIELFKDYSTNGNLTVDTKGNYYFTNWRIAMDNNYAYLEGWTSGFSFGGDNTFNTIIDAYGWDSGGWTLYSEPLTAGLSSPSYIIRASYINLNGRTLQRNISTGGSEADDFVTVNGLNWQSAFDNPTIDLFTFPTPSVIYANLICEVEVWQTPWSNVSTGSAHIGYANYGNQGGIKNVTTMVQKGTMPSGGQSNVGTLSWSGNTLRYTSNRASNYDHYSLKYTVRHQEMHNISYYY